MSKPREGDWFAVPLRDRGYAVGLIARAPRRGDTLVGYFFGPIRNEVPKPDEVGAYGPDDAVMIARFEPRDAVVSGRWPIITSASDWQRSNWPMPEFHIPFSYEVTGESWAVTYAEDNPDRFVRQRRIPFEEEAHYPKDGVAPPTHIEYRLAEKLGAPLVDDEAEASDAGGEEGVSHFLLVPPNATEEIRQQLSKRGFDEVEVLDDVELLDEWNGLANVVAFQPGDIHALRAGVDDMEAKLTKLARSVGGEYDGREWALPPS